MYILQKLQKLNLWDLNRFFVYIIFLSKGYISRVMFLKFLIILYF